MSHTVESFSIIAVNLFILITGYFSFHKVKININKLVNIWLIMIFYGIILSIVGAKLTGTVFNLSFAKRLIEQTFSQWFVVIYTILYLLIPFINKLLNGLSKKSIQLILFINIIFFYVWPTFFTKTPDNDGGYGILNFITLYIIGYYIHKYSDQLKKKWKNFIIYLLFSIITIGFSLITGRAWNYNSIFVLISSVAFFELFRAIKIKPSKTINYLATFTFSIYLIDVNGFFNKWLYRGLFKTPNFWNSPWLLVHVILTTIGIYILCVLIEMLRKLLFNRLFNWIAQKIKFEIKVK